jgi:hypothetical protein
VVDWQMTATSIYCEAVDDDVTIMVDKDWNTSCTGNQRYGESISRETASMLQKKGRKMRRELKCTRLANCGATLYRDRLMAEEKNSADQ